MLEVSVIIPTYNRDYCIKEAIDSVIQQSYNDYELLIIDDGSTDDTGKIVERRSEKLRYIYQKHRGVSAARNTGIKVAKGRYIAFLDSDDLWLPHKLKKQIEFMNNHPDAVACYTEEIWIRRGVRVNPGKRHTKYSGWIFERCLPLCIISPSSILMRYKLLEEIGGFDENLPVCEDYDLWLRVSLRYQIFLIQDRLIIKQGGHPDQLSTMNWGNDRYRVIGLEKILRDKRLTLTQRESVLQELVNKCNILYNGYKKRGKIEACIYKEKMEIYKEMRYAQS